MLRTLNLCSSAGSGGCNRTFVLQGALQLVPAPRPDPLFNPQAVKREKVLHYCVPTTLRVCKVL